MPDELLYIRCPSCHGRLKLPGSATNGSTCACVTTLTPGYAPCPFPVEGTGRPMTRGNLSSLQNAHDRLLVTIWEVASVDESSEAAYTAAAHVHGRQTAVYVAMRNLGTGPLPHPDHMTLPDHEGYKAARDARRSATPEPDGPPGSHAELVADLRRQLDAAEAAHTKTIRERDAYSDALAATHRTLGGDGEWRAALWEIAIPPDTGDLSRDVPVLAEELIDDRDHLLVAVADLVTARQPTTGAQCFADVAKANGRAATAELRAKIALGGRTELAEKVRARLFPPDPEPVAAGLTFAHLAVGDHFIVIGDDGDERRSLMVKCDPIRSQKTPDAVPYNTLDHATGVALRTPPAAAVVRIDLGQFGRRGVNVAPVRDDQ